MKESVILPVPAVCEKVMVTGFVAQIAFEVELEAETTAKYAPPTADATSTTAMMLGSERATALRIVAVATPLADLTLSKTRQT